MTRVQTLAYRLRFLLLVLAVLCVGGAIAWVLDNDLGSPGFFIFLGVFFASQFVFLLPRRYWPMRLARKPRPMWVSYVIAAACMALLTAGLIATILEVPDWWEPIADTLDDSDFWRILAVLWMLWTFVFFIYFRGPDAYGGLWRIVKALIAGSILELLISVPVLAFMPDRHNCTCGRGSFVGVFFGILVLLWTFGPGVALVFLLRVMRVQRLIRAGDSICPKCEYDLRGTLAAGRTACPECGADCSMIPRHDGSSRP
jgi:hypothetical protein